MKPSPEENASGRVVVGDVVEFAAPIDARAPRVSFVVRVERVLHGVRQLVEQHPSQQPISLVVPTATFYHAFWSV